MNTEEAILTLDSLRKSVITVVGPNRTPVAMSGADHDLLREAIETIKKANAPKPEETK